MLTRDASGQDADQQNQAKSEPCKDSLLPASVKTEETAGQSTAVLVSEQAAAMYAMQAKNSREAV